MPLTKTSHQPRILLIGPNWLGDVLFLTPVIRSLRKRFATAYLACLVPLRVEPLLRTNPHLNEVILYDDRASILSIPHTISLVRRLRKAGFDSAILFHRSKSKALFTWLAGIPNRVGYDTKGFVRRKFLTHAYEPPAQEVHRIDYYEHLINQLGIISDGRWMDFEVSCKAQEQARELFKTHGIDWEKPFVLIHPTANWELKCWPAESFVRWIQLFRKTYDWPVILCAAEREKAITRSIAGRCDAGVVYDFAGETSIDVLTVLIQHAKLFLSNDSGPIHLAATQQAQIIGIFGPTHPKLTGPVAKKPVTVLWKDVGCQIPCYFRSCNYRVCMDSVTPEEVMKAARELLDKKK